MPNTNPTVILRKEHDQVLNILDTLERQLENPDLTEIKKTIDLLEKEFNKHSLNKEEKVLFLEIEKFIPREGGPTGTMIMEHKDLVESMKSFNDAINTSDLEKLNNIGDHIIEVLRVHIEKENTALFKIADLHLTDDQKDSCLEQFQEIDSKI